MRRLSVTGLVVLFMVSAACGSSNAPTAPSFPSVIGGQAAADSPSEEPNLKATPPVVVQPKDRVRLETLTPTLEWQNARGKYRDVPFTYQVELYEGYTPLRVYSVEQDLSGRTRLVVDMELKRDTLYRWRVRAQYGDGFGAWDGPADFLTPVLGARWSLRFAKYLAFGDSLTSGVTSPNAIDLAAGAGDEYWSMLSVLLREQYPDQSITVAGAGLPGEWALNGVNRLPLVLAADRPEVLLLMEGVNDLNFYGDSGVLPAVRTIERMIGTARTAGIEVIVATLPPERPGGSRAWAPSAVAAFNALLRDRIPMAGAVLADVGEAMAQDLSLIGPDGLHPTHEGYRRIAEVFYETIRRHYEEERPAVTWSTAGRSTY